MTTSEENFLGLLEKRRQREKTQQSLQHLEGQLAQEEGRLKDLGEQLQRENEDVDSLEGLSLVALFYTVLGGREAQLEKERQGVLAAKLRFDVAAHTVQALKREVRQRQDQLRAFAGVETEYEQALEARAQSLKIAKTPDAAELETLEARAAQLHEEARSLHDAVLAGEQALEALDDLKAALSSAENWGVWDMFGGGLLVTHAKHSRINDARQIAHHAQQYLRRLQTELEELNQTADLQVNTGTLLSFADYFIDGLLADWIIQSRIHHSKQQVEQTSTNVQQLLTILRGRQRSSTEQRSNALEQRRQLLERIASEA